MIEILFYDSPFSRVNVITFKLDLVSPYVQQIATKNKLVNAVLYFLRKSEKWRAVRVTVICQCSQLEE